jgi:hypothetical protein
MTVGKSLSFSETLRRLGLATGCGGNRATIKKYINQWNISIEHFDPAKAREEGLIRYRSKGRLPLDKILIQRELPGWEAGDESVLRGKIENETEEISPCGLPSAVPSRVGHSLS